MRHQAIGVIPHIIGAVVVTGVVMAAGLGVLMHYMNHTALRRSALALLSLTFTQVFLGVAAYMSRIATANAPQPMPAMVWLTVAHVAVGALTMAAGAVLAIQVHRNIVPAPALLAKAA